LLANLVIAFRWHLILAAETKSPGPSLTESQNSRLCI
jgi:hypothetical protein